MTTQSNRSSFPLWLLSSAIFLMSVSCSSSNNTSPSTTISSPEAIVVTKTNPSPSPTLVHAAKEDAYQLAIEQAASATTISQSAQSKDDWKLVASRWQKAIDVLKIVPSVHPKFAQSQKKLAEYTRNLDYAQQKANQAVLEPKAIVSIKAEVLTENENDVSDSCSQLEQQYEAAKLRYDGAEATVTTYSYTDKFGGFPASLARAKVNLAEADLELSRIESEYNQLCL